MGRWLQRYVVMQKPSFAYCVESNDGFKELNSDSIERYGLLRAGSLFVLCSWNISSMRTIPPYGRREVCYV